LVSELTARSSAYDLLVFPPYFLGDFVALGFLRDLDQYKSLVDPQLDDYLPVYRDPVIKRNGKLYALMYDGDNLQVIYRTDLFNDPTEQKNFKAKYGWDLAPPKTWDQFMQIAEFFTRPPNLYGTAFYAQRGFCYAWFINIFAGMGGRWFSDDMKPGINSEAGVKALEMLVKQKQYSPPNILQIGYPELNDAFLNGSTAMVVQWNDLPLKVGDPKMSKVVGKGGVAPIPVRTYMPYSRVMAVSAFSKNPEDAYRVAAHMQLPEVTITYVYDSNCGQDPYRASSLKWEAATKNHEGGPALDPELAKAYVETIKEGLKDGYPELSIPGAPRYLDILDLYVSQALAGTLPAKAALDAAANEWNSITQAEDPDSQKAAYAAWVKSFKDVGVAY
jgi:multiple sugar transport system substrate-binding protein